MAGALMVRLNYSLLAKCRISFAVVSQSILPWHSGFPFSTLADENGGGIHHLRNPFALFASSKFHLSAADISYIFKQYPRLQRLQTLNKVEDFVGKLEENGFKQEQIAKLITRRPMLLCWNVKEVMEPKLQVLKDSGICGEHLVKVLTDRPLILGFSLEELIPRVRLLQYAFQSQKLFLRAVLKNPSILTFNVENVLKPSVAFWEGYGFRGMELAKLFVLHPRLLLYASFTHAQLDLFHKLGFGTEKKINSSVLKVVVGSSMKTLEAKINNFQHCGLSYDETMGLLRSTPYVFLLTEESIRTRMDFIVNTMELPPNTVVKFSKLLSTGFATVVKPRCLVWKKIKLLNGLDNLKIKSFNTMMGLREADFVTKIIEGHLEAATLHSIYKKAIANASSRTCTAAQRSQRKSFF